MRVQVKRTFKSFFLSPKNPKNVDRLCMKFDAPILLCSIFLNHLFQNQCSIILFPPLFSKNISTIILESIKWVSKHSVDCPSCLSGLTSKIYHISIDRIGFYFFLVSLIFSEVRVSHHGWRKFSDLRCTDYIGSRHFYSCSSRLKYLKPSPALP